MMLNPDAVPNVFSSLPSRDQPRRTGKRKLPSRTVREEPEEKLSKLKTHREELVLMERVRCCRLCAKVAENPVSIFPSEVSQTSFDEIIAKYLKIEVTREDRLPLELCRNCADTLIAFNKLAEEAVEAEVKLKQLISDLDNVVQQEGDKCAEKTSPEDHSQAEKESKSCQDESSAAKSDTEDDIPFLDEFEEFLEKKKPSTKKDVVRKTKLSSDISEAGPRVYICDICGKRLSKRYNYERHLKVHTGETLTCETCGKQYRGKSSLDIHVKTVHAQTKDFACYVCARSFPNRTALDNHFRTHTGERPFGCEQCGLTFRTRSGLTGHLSIHAVEPPLQCAICGARFRQRCSLVDHLARHANKRCPCSVCGKSFATRNDLWKHQQIHRTDRNFQCPACEASFTVRRYLVVHLRTHAAKK